MESSEEALAKLKITQQLNIPDIAECIRPFQLQQQYPSTVKKIIRIGPNSPALDATGKPKSGGAGVRKLITVPMKIIQDGRTEEKNLIKVSNAEDREITYLDEQLLSRLGQQSRLENNGARWTVKARPTIAAASDSTKPQVKTITTLVNGIPIENYRRVSQGTILKDKVGPPVPEGNKPPSTKTNINSILANLKKISLPADQIASHKVIQNGGESIIKKLIYKKPSLLEQSPSQYITLQKAPQQLLKLQNGQNAHLNKIFKVKPVPSVASLLATTGRKRSGSPSVSEGEQEARERKRRCDVPNASESGAAALPLEEDQTQSQDTLAQGEPQPVKGEVQKLDIIQKALMSCSDAQLRAQALRVLKECEVGKDRVTKEVPQLARQPVRTVCDFGSQTEVFSLLRWEEFVQVVEDREEVARIKISQKRVRQSVEVLTGTLGPSDTELSKLYLECNEDRFRCDLDSMVEKNFPNSKGVMEVKKALVYSNVDQARFLLTKLIKDFESARNYDEDGLLPVHRAVINNDVKEIQKQIGLLKATKQNIDVCTRDEKTSLELAVDYEVNQHIIGILLDAGAQPVSSQLIHDSAVIIACKTSSRILPLLLKYVNDTNRELLNAKNLEGFAALHYCAQLGNLEGVVELLKLKVNPNIQDDRSGRTPLYYAIDTKSTDISQEVYSDIGHKLIEAGAYSDVPMYSKHNCLTLIDDVKNHSLKIALNKAVQV